MRLLYKVYHRQVNIYKICPLTTSLTAVTAGPAQQPASQPLYSNHSTFQHFNMASQFKFIGNFWSNVLKSYRGPWNPFESYSIEGESREFTNLHFPLHKTVCIGVPMYTQ